jgi:hypothetical protein
MAVDRGRLGWLGRARRRDSKARGVSGASSASRIGAGAESSSSAASRCRRSLRHGAGSVRFPSEGRLRSTRRTQASGAGVVEARETRAPGRGFVAFRASWIRGLRRQGPAHSRSTACPGELARGLEGRRRRKHRVSSPARSAPPAREIASTRVRTRSDANGPVAASGTAAITPLSSLEQRACSSLGSAAFAMQGQGSTLRSPE